MENTQTTDLLKKVRKIEIRTRALSHQVFAGEYHSAYKGRGMAFSEVREYQYGDDVRNMDWNVTARLRTPYVKVFEEERELTVMLLIDVSRSGLFGTDTMTKRDLTAEVAAVLAFSAILNNDKVGALFFSDRVEEFIPPKKGRSHLLHIIREIISLRPTSNGTDLSGALRFLTNAMKKKCTAFVLSDMLDVDSDGKPRYEDALKVACFHMGFQKWLSRSVCCHHPGADHQNHCKQFLHNCVIGFMPVIGVRNSERDTRRRGSRR